jgi:hypothetical protein
MATSPPGRTPKAARRGRKPATTEAYDYALRIHIVPFFGVQPMDRINREDVRRFTRSCRELVTRSPRRRSRPRLQPWGSFAFLPVVALAGPV